MKTLELFAGCGGGVWGHLLLGHEPVCYVEVEERFQKILQARQDDGSFPEGPIFGDIREFDGKLWKGKVDVVSGGFPCQDLSVATNGKGQGLKGEKSSLWFEMLRVIQEVEPEYVFIENVPPLAKERTWTGTQRTFRKRV